MRGARGRALGGAGRRSCAVDNELAYACSLCGVSLHAATATSPCLSCAACHCRHPVVRGVCAPTPPCLSVTAPWLSVTAARWSNMKGEGKLFSFDLLDVGGGEIRCTAFNDQAEKFFAVVEVGWVRGAGTRERDAGAWALGLSDAFVLWQGTRQQESVQSNCCAHSRHMCSCGGHVQLVCFVPLPIVRGVYVVAKASLKHKKPVGVGVGAGWLMPNLASHMLPVCAEGV